MKQRTTFLLHSLDAIDTDNAQFTEELVSLPGSLFSLRQDRLSVAIDQLPQDVREVFEKLYMFRVQWNSVDAKHDPVFQNYGEDGLSVYLIPRSIEYETIFDGMGALLKKNLGVGFNHTEMISTATSATFHTSTQIKSSTFQNFLNQLVGELDRISFVQSFDLRWEESKLIVEWTSQPYEANIRKSPTIRKEVALFQSTRLSQDDLELSGIRTVLSEEESVPPTKTLLIVKPRHQDQNVTANIDFEQPIGLHPTLKVQGIAHAEKPYVSCEMFMFATVPNTLFFDKYQYDESKITLLNNWGEADLEAPVWKVSKFGSSQLFHITNYTDFEVKYHSRYIEPSAANAFDMSVPELFWACDAREFMDEEEEVEKLDGNPFDTYQLGYESFFEPSTVFYHLGKETKTLEYKIPTADASDYDTIQLVTAGAVVLGSLYLFKKLWSSYTKISTTDDTKKTK